MITSISNTFTHLWLLIDKLDGELGSNAQTYLVSLFLNTRQEINRTQQYNEREGRASKVTDSVDCSERNELFRGNSWAIIESLLGLSLCQFV